MIDQALDLVLDRMNAFLDGRFPGGGPHAVLSSDVSRPTGAPPLGSIMLSVANIERGAGGSRPIGLRPVSGSSTVPSVFSDLALLLLVSARFGSDETGGWRLLAAALEFFHATPAMVPAPASSLGRVEAVPFNARLDDLDSIWSIRGGQYRPGFLMTLRLTPATGA